MSIENQLAQLTEATQALTEVNKQILAAIQAGTTFAGQAGSAFVAQDTSEAAPAKRGRKPKNAEAAQEPAAAEQPAEKQLAEPAPFSTVVLGDPEGTAYWYSEKHKMLFAQLPTEAAPAEHADFKRIEAAEYVELKAKLDAGKQAVEAAQAKAEEAKKAEAAATTPQQPATTEPTATAQPATASAQPSALAIDFASDVTPALMALAQSHGAHHVKAIMTKLAPSATKVSDMKDMGLEDKIMAEIEAIKNPSDDALFA